ncbi:hypothetical protein GF351_05765 [Candidatus Woesearchaeota archaeon]|nr:hypothetical protein [Candidatus Woesearchaeota archaeon]
MKKAKTAHLEAVYVAVFLFLMLGISYGAISDHRFNHDHPYGYMASDAFQHQVRAESIKQMGNYRHEPFWAAAGYKDAVGFYPPVLNDLSVMLSYGSGAETYDTIYFLVFFFIALGSILFYLVVRDFSRNLAIISLPFAILVFSNNAYWGFVTGHWPSTMAQFFLIAVFWVMMRFRLEKSYLLLAVFVSAIIMSHASEVLFAVMFIAVFAGLKLLSKKMDSKEKKRMVRNLAIAVLIVLLLTFYFAVILKFTWLASSQGSMLSSFESQPADLEGPALVLQDLGIVAVILLVGVAFSVWAIWKRSPSGLTASVLMFLAGYGNHIGLVHWTGQIRYLWPLYFSAAAGFGIYSILKMSIKRWKVVYSFGIAIFLILWFTGTFGIPPHYDRIEGRGLMDPYHWDAFTWTAENTPEDSTVYFFYGDIFSQNAMLRNTERKHIMYTSKGLEEVFSESLVPRYVHSKLIGDSHGVYYAYRRSFFDYGYYFIEDGGRDAYYRYYDICDMDYLFLDKVSQQPALAQYNLLIRQELLSRDGFEEVYSNEVVSIIRNNNPGIECLPEEGVKIDQQQ